MSFTNFSGVFGVYEGTKLIESGARGNIVIILPDRGDRYFTKHLYE